MPQTEINVTEFTLEIYSYETNEWRETVISHSLGFSFTTYTLSPSFAHSGMVYWLDYCGVLIGVDPFNNFNTTINTTANSGVCQGRLIIFCVWELKEAEDDQQVDGIAGKLKKWCLLKVVSLNQMLVENPGIAEWRERNRWLRSRAVAIDPNDEDILYLDFDGDIVACNFRTRTSFKRAIETGQMVLSLLSFILGRFTMSSEEPDIGKLHLNVIKLRDHLEKVVLDQYTALIKSEARKKDLTKELERSEARCQELRKVLEQTEAQKNKEDRGGSEAQNKELENYHGDKGLKKELEFCEARGRELKKELELSEAQKNELKNQLFQCEAKNNEVKKQLEQSDAQINGLNENLQKIEAEKRELTKNLQESEDQKKELKNDLQQREAENKELEKDLYQKEVELQESNELQHNADETVEWLKDERKQWRDQEVKLHNKISILEKQRNTNLKQVDELEVKIHEIEGKFKELEEELGNNKALNGVLIVNEHEKNVELQEARKVLIIGLSDSKSQTCIGVKRMGELDNKPFRSALKRPCPSKRGAGLDDKAKKLCSLWEQHLRDPNWQPFRIIMNEQQKPTEFIDEQDEKLKGLREEFGEQVFEAVKTALAELNEYNPSGRFPVPELWNFKEERKATVAEGVSYLMNLWKPNIRTRRSSQILNNQLRSPTSEVLERKTVLGYQSMGSEAKIIALCKPTTGRLYRATGLPGLENSNFHPSSEAELCLLGSKVWDSLSEMLTGKRPADDRFPGDLNLHSFVELAFPNRVMEIADSLLLQEALKKRLINTVRELRRLSPQSIGDAFASLPCQSPIDITS
ncbi:hypothetical protein C1H46_002534 [Malus baccata]|uniref:Factor of DNA methylation 1-5/IDN2 domain-containing protein n=1 Tax=Malus baccata TaxID=106549 RepID=A0A540NMZ4_MALBA|nr:hypothetical protein C1H46_002534 [Malus baccata]